VSKIVQIPDPVLTSKAGLNLPQERQWLRAALEEMEIALGMARGVGIAAPQVGLPYRIAIMAPGRVGMRAYVNPTYKPVERSGRNKDREGCLSVDNGHRHVEIERWSEIVAEGVEVRGWHPGGRLRTHHFRSHLKGFEARVWQHECDHLDGILLGGADLSKPPEPGVRPATILAAVGILASGVR
jgi:peptide deformylase